MKLEYDCFSCSIDNLVNQLNLYEVNGEDKERFLKSYLKKLSEIDFRITPPELGRELHNGVKKLLNNPDPFKERKAYYNSLLMGKYEEFESLVASSDDPFYAALKLSLAGNIIDFGALKNVDLDELFEKIKEADITVDESKELRKDIENARNLLYLGDNSGEIVFDKLFIQTINELYREKKIHFVVRGGPIINDITKFDAEVVKMDEYAEVIDNGYDAPGTILNKCSREFLTFYNKADLVISKGQGNLESLDEENKNIYFLLTAKCAPVARKFGVSKGSLIVARTKSY